MKALVLKTSVLVLLGVSPALCQTDSARGAPQARTAHVAGGFAMPIEFNGAAPGGDDRAGRIGVATALWVEAAAGVGRGVSIGAHVEIPSSYQRGYRRPGGGAIEAALEHRDVLVEAAVMVAGAPRRVHMRWTASVGIAHSLTHGTIATTGPFLPPTPPSELSIADNGVTAAAGADIVIEMKTRVSVLLGGQARWIPRSAATREQGIASFGVTPRPVSV